MLYGDLLRDFLDMCQSASGWSPESNRMQVYPKGNTIFNQHTISRKERDRMFCGECGTQNPDTNQFCSNCGKPLKKNLNASPVAPLAPAAAPVPVQQAAPQPLSPAVIPCPAARLDSSPGTDHNWPSSLSSEKVASELACDRQLHFGSPIVGDLSDNYWNFCNGFRNFLTLLCKKGTIKNHGDCRHRSHHRASGNCSQFLLAGYLPSPGNPPPDKIKKILVLPASFLFPFSYYQ